MFSLMDTFNANALVFPCNLPVAIEFVKAQSSNQTRDRYLHPAVILDESMGVLKISPGRVAPHMHGDFNPMKVCMPRLISD